MNLEKIFIFFGWFLLCFLLQYNIFIGLGAVIGVAINAPVFYWICFGVYATCKIINITVPLLED